MSGRKFVGEIGWVLLTITQMLDGSVVECAPLSKGSRVGVAGPGRASACAVGDGEDPRAGSVRSVGTSFDGESTRTPATASAVAAAATPASPPPTPSGRARRGWGLPVRVTRLRGSGAERLRTSAIVTSLVVTVARL